MAIFISILINLLFDYLFKVWKVKIYLVVWNVVCKAPRAALDRRYTNLKTDIGQSKHCIRQPFSRCLISLRRSLFHFNSNSIYYY